jgi:hypothetical protein
MSENMASARQIENGRMTFNSFFIALTAGVLALLPEIGGQGHYAVGAMLCGVMVLLSAITILLVKRWNDTYQRYVLAARRCYEELQRLALGEETPPFTACEFPTRGSRGTKHVFIVFNALILAVWACLLLVLLRKAIGAA